MPEFYTLPVPLGALVAIELDVGLVETAQRSPAFG
jgi:hypothetical protein